MSFASQHGGGTFLTEQHGYAPLSSTNSPVLRSLTSSRALHTSSQVANSRSASPFHFERSSSSFGCTNLFPNSESERQHLSLATLGSFSSGSSSRPSPGSPISSGNPSTKASTFTGSSNGDTSSFNESLLSVHANPFGGSAASVGGANSFNTSKPGTTTSSRVGSFTSAIGSAAVSNPNSAGSHNSSSGFGASSDLSRRSSTGYASSLGGDSATAPIAINPSHGQQSHSPFPETASSHAILPIQPSSQGQAISGDPIEAAIQMATSGASASSQKVRSPLSTASSSTGQEQSRNMPYSTSLRSASPSFFASANASSSSISSSRPFLTRQSFSDGYPNSISPFIQGAAAAPLVEMRDEPSLSGPTATLNTGQASVQQPLTGPLSASDPRTQLLVSNLPYRVRWQDLKDLFRKAGTVLRADVSLSPDNRSRGYGTVLMATEEDAIKAADMLGGFTWQGRTLEVRVDRSGTLVGVAGSAATLGQGMTAGQGQQGAMQTSHSGGGVSNHAFLNVSSIASQNPNATGRFGSSSPSPGVSAPSTSSTVSGTGVPSIDHAAGLSDFERGFMQGQLHSVGIQQVAFGQQPTQLNPAVYPFMNSPMNPSPRQGSETNAHPSQAAGWVMDDEVANTVYNPSAGGSSVPTGFPGASAMVPWPAGSATLSGSGSFALQSQPFGSQYGASSQSLSPNAPTTSYTGRVLFVGNLPFHCQWQDLKDLFRAAGNIQRADVAIGPDGRSRGFGTVLFAAQEDAQNAVRLYHGYEYSGRTLKVHFDRFAAQTGPAIGTPGAPSQYTGAFAAAQLPSHVSHNGRMPSYPSQSHQLAKSQNMYPGYHEAQQHQQLQEQQQQPQPQSQAMANVSQTQSSLQPSLSAGLDAAQPQSFSALGPATFSSQQTQASRQGSFSGARESLSAPQFDVLHFQGQNLFPQEPSQFQTFPPAPLDRAEDVLNAPPHQDGQRDPYSYEPTLSKRDGDTQTGGRQQGHEQQQQYSLQPYQQPQLEHRAMHISLPNIGMLNGPSAFLPSDLISSPGLSSPPRTAVGTHGGARPGRIQLPPNGFSAISSGQLSPLSTRINVPMTPGMPGFTFQPIAQTPPLYPQFLSPGLGPFSPSLGESHVAPIGGDAHSGFSNYINPAPGAPLGYNPMFSMAATYVAPSEQSISSISQQQPPTPHWSQTSGPVRSNQYQASAVDDQNYFGHGQGHYVQSEFDPRDDIARTPGAGPRSRVHANRQVPGGAQVLARRASDCTPGAVTPPAADEYPFPLVGAPNSGILARRASTNSSAASPLPHGTGSRDSDGPPVNVARDSLNLAQEVLASSSTEELANTIARLSVKGTALIKDPIAKRSLSMTAERSAAANVMAKLREQVGTPVARGRAEYQSGAESSSAGTAFRDGSAVDSEAFSRTGLGEASASSGFAARLPSAPVGHNLIRPSPLSHSQLAAPNSGNALFNQPYNHYHYNQQQQQQPPSHRNHYGKSEVDFQSTRDRLLGVSVSASLLEVATNGSALDTSSTPSGSLMNTLAQEGGPESVGKSNYQSGNQVGM